MKIIQITPSAGDSYYCENCLRDAALAKSIIKLGHEGLTVPLYLPLPGEQSGSAGISPIFFGGLNVYLQQKSAFFRKTPRWFDNLFDSPGLLRWIGRKAGMTSARDLGETTISMLRGEKGRQTKELDRLVEWLQKRENRPDIICLSNILLAGLAKTIKQRLGVPVVCLLQDEDGFLDGLISPYSHQAWQIISERAGDIDAFIGVSKYYTDTMRQRLELNPDRTFVVYTGISLDGYESNRDEPAVPTIGYLSRMCTDRGLDTLVDAFLKLKKNDKLKDAKLRLAGGKRSDDEALLKKIGQKLRSQGIIDDVEFLPDFDRDSRIAFLKSLSVLSVPEKQPVAYGLYVLESLAAGVPVVEPASGVFPELLEMTDGGLLFEPNNIDALAETISSLLLDPDKARTLGEQGRAAVSEKFNIEQTAGQMVRIYGQIAQKYKDHDA
ncbi:MAG: glycosyltransferase family 4 protein [Planctomycetota bacterium]|jgi:glycosyltransferase involved in cell wall biosynthesis